MLLSLPGVALTARWGSLQGAVPCKTLCLAPPFRIPLLLSWGVCVYLLKEFIPHPSPTLRGTQAAYKIKSQSCQPG